MKANPTIGFALNQMVATAASAVVLAALALAMAGCGSSSSTSSTTPTTPSVEAPGPPTSFSVVRTPETTLSVTLAWSSPAAGGSVESYEIYRSTTAGGTYTPENHLVSVPADPDKTTPYTFVDNAGLTPRVETFWVVSAMNAGGETPTAEVAYTPIGGVGGGDTAFGNNFAAALIFADNKGIGGLDITGAWTKILADIDPATGLRPTADEIIALQAQDPTVIELPYLDPTTEFPLGTTPYYKQKTISTWQGEWRLGGSEQQHVTASWGDNLISQRLTASSVVRIEMVLTKALDPSAPMTSYVMQSLYGSRANEVQGTDGTTYENTTAFVFATNARLKIEKLDGQGGGVVGVSLYDQGLWQGDGPGYLAGEVNVSGNFTYGFVWNLSNQELPPSIPSKTGWWRLTFSLPGGNTVIDTAANGELVAGEARIEIEILP